MYDHFLTQPLMAGQVDQAYPIVQSFVDGLEIERWRTFAERYIGNQDCDSGIMTIQSGGYIHGLFSYRVEPSLAHDRTLLIDNFLVLDLFDPSGVESALVDAVDIVSRNLRCEAVHTALPAHPSYSDGGQATASQMGLVERFRALGHEVECVLVCKRLRASQPLPEGLTTFPFPVQTS